jgi:XTP/dITP diphosphohydrolase
MKVLLASANLHNIQEISDLLGDVPGLELLSLRQYPELQLPEETGSTMAENARLKASYCARETGLPSLADDSGLEVDALGGEPGVRSARWHEGTDEERTAALLKRLEQVENGDQRSARYRCAICLALIPGPGEEPVFHETEATCEGRIAWEFRGANGFGYDPIFEITAQTGAAPDFIGQTMAQAAPAVKAQVSHRARAIRLIENTLRELAIA